MNLSILSIEQRLAFEKFCRGENVFVTGPGGTGKTKLIEFFVQYCKNVGRMCQVTAMTGCATTLLPASSNARTIHSWSGIRLCKGEKDKIVQGVLRKKKHRTAWNKTRVLIVDEVSMMSKKVFEILEEIARTANLSTKVFGGMQVVFTGDFLQLPPVPSTDEKDSEKFCFETPLWEKVFPFSNNIELRTMFRQSDPVYQKILLEVRKGKLSESNIDILNKYVQHTQNDERNDESLVTRLFPVRFKTDALNQRQYTELQTPEHVYLLEKQMNCKTNMETGKSLSVEEMLKCESLTQIEKEYEMRNLLATTNYQEELCLKKGCVVMCSTNLDLDNHICNGSQGIIIGFSENQRPIVRFSHGITRTLDPQFRQSDEYPCLAVAQIPLCLAWGLTIHKIQGATLDRAEMDIGKSIFECGQTYVALSRIKSLDGLSLSAFNPHNIRANSHALAFYNELGTMDYEKELNTLILASTSTGSNPFSEYELQEEVIEPKVINETNETNKKCVLTMNIQKSAKESTSDKTWNLYLKKHTLDEIATMRGLKQNTIKEHFITKLPDERVNVEDLMPLETYDEIKGAFDTLGNEPLGIIKQQIRYDISYTDIKIVKRMLFGAEEPKNDVKQVSLI